MLIESMLGTQKQEKYTSEVDMGVKESLETYLDRKNRVKILREKKIELEKDIERLNNSIARDTVTGGYGGTQHFVVEGRPDGLISKKRTILERRMQKLDDEEVQLALALEEVEDCIASITDYEIKNLFELYYLKGMTWKQVERKMNKLYPHRNIPYREENCKKKAQRFFKKM